MDQNLDTFPCTEKDQKAVKSKHNYNRHLREDEWYMQVSNSKLQLKIKVSGWGGHERMT